MIENGCLFSQCYLLLIKYYIGFYKTGSDIEKLHPMTTEPKINKTIYSKKRYALDDQLEIFFSPFVHFNF